VLQGALLPAYASDTAGSSTLVVNGPTDTDWFVGTGSLVASTLQMQAGSISNTATATNNSIHLDILNAEDDASVIASPALEDNAIAASVTGNSSNSTINVLAGGAATLAGTAVVTNGQLNGQFTVPLDASANIAASNGNSTIIATIAADGDSTSDDAELQGSLPLPATQSPQAPAATGRSATPPVRQATASCWLMARRSKAANTPATTAPTSPTPPAYCSPR
jgi:hypothetical protein